MKHNDNDPCSSSRRSFLKTAAAGAVIAASPAVDAGGIPNTRRDADDSGRAQALLKRYGGEFGEVGRGGA